MVNKLKYLYGRSLLKFMELYKNLKKGYINYYDAITRITQRCAFCFDAGHSNFHVGCSDCKIDRFRSSNNNIYKNK